MKLMKFSLKKIFLLFFLFFILYSLFFILVPSAQATWVKPDPEVTEVGRNAERARQLLFWLFVTPSLDSSPAIRSMWAVSRNIVLGLFVLMVVLIGIALILSRTRGPVGEVFSGIASPLYGARLPAILIKVATFLGFVVFSYVIILGLIQISDIMMRFFIERVGGANLFNVTLNPENIKNIEKNYEYFGAREDSLEFIESVRTNLFMVRLTTFTYNIMFIALVLRKIILWFLLIVSPFLALLMPFIFIRNIGWIWIGVFMQWLFYGPLLSIFLAGLVKIWEFGIPYAFDFSRVDKPEGQIFKTATDLLYGGPAQTLTGTNSCNYVDTYAEYVIALIMLWTVILLPWLLLRIFRDYCCEAFKSQESAVMALYNRLAGGFPTPPPPPPPPTGPAAARFELPFKAKAPIARELPEVITATQVAQIAKAETREILRAMNLEVVSIRDVASFEMNLQKQHTARETLSQLSKPAEVPSVIERRKFSTLRQEIASRAIEGDVQAQRVLTAAEGKTPTIAAHLQRPHIKIVTAEPAKRPGLPVTATIKPVPPTPVTLEEYEEVKKMWLKHYREAEVPVSEKIKTREEWLKIDLAQITNTVELLISKKTEEKQQGYDQVAAILPFLLLGGFSEEQTVTYLKAKLEAAKVVLEELERAEKLKEEAKKEAEEELVEVPTPKVKEKEKEAELKAKLEMGTEAGQREGPSSKAGLATEHSAEQAETQKGADTEKSNGLDKKTNFQDA